LRFGNREKLSQMIGFRVQINADVGVAYNIDGSALPGHA
jgi:hypothetical protein